METQQVTQAQGEKHVRSPFLKRMIQRSKQFLKDMIGNTRLYKAMRVGYHYYTESKRRNSGNLVIKKHRTKKKVQQVRQKQEEVRWNRQTPSAQFFPLYSTQEPTPELHALSLSLPVRGDSSVTVERTGDRVRQYHRQLLAEADTNRIGIRPVRHLQYLIEPEVVPDRAGVTAQEAAFLLDRHFARVEEDPDVTTKREAIKKAG